MNTYLQAIGWWNLIGSILMFGFLNQKFGQKMLNDWMQLFKDKFELDYWGKLWFVWAAGLNVFFGLINILSVDWALYEMKQVLVIFDICAYIIFVGLVIWGLQAGRLLRSGAISTLTIFAVWIGWGVYAIWK